MSELFGNILNLLVSYVHQKEEIEWHQIDMIGNKTKKTSIRLEEQIGSSIEVK